MVILAFSKDGKIRYEFIDTEWMMAEELNFAEIKNFYSP